jgi:hypothetical protein
MDGELPCNTTPVECRQAFWDVYDGTYQGDAAGSLILDVDILGGVVGTVTLVGGTSTALQGQVNEFGKLVATTEDGTEYTGQFTSDKRDAGTWTAADGTNGTFEAASMSATGPASTSPAASDSSPPSMGSVMSAEVLAAATDACEALQSCEGVDPPDCSTLTEASLLPAECSAFELAVYTCQGDAGCDFATACDAEAEAAFNCLLGEPEPGAEPGEPDPGTGFEATGNSTYDEAILTCSACLPEATACHDASVCLEYAECSTACTTVPCLQRCLTLYEEGYNLWLASMDCTSLNCPQD